MRYLPTPQINKPPGRVRRAIEVISGILFLVTTQLKWHLLTVDGIIWTFNSRIVRKFARWIHRMYTTRTRVGQVQVNNIVPATGGLVAGGGVGVIVMSFFSSLLISQACEYTVFQQHLDACRLQNSTTAVDVLINAQSNFSNIAVYADDYREVSAVFRHASFDTGTLLAALELGGQERDYIKMSINLTEQYSDGLMKAADVWDEFSEEMVGGTTSIVMHLKDLDPYFRQLTEKSSYVWKFLGYSDELDIQGLETEIFSTIDEILKVINHLKLKADETKAGTVSLTKILRQLFRSAKTGIDAIQDDKKSEQKTE
ncbi:hypothetical protein PG993_005737 [Apiospora rasikravindrae]|uniref:Uncharacterized protein n=1 Tax=Apiospora rasikravindrae TaxID=990691 RepID=A0ABR1T9M8_9PEZI